MPERLHRDRERGGYVTADGLYFVDSDTPSDNEWDDTPTPIAWYVWDSAAYDRGASGIPDAIHEAHTLSDVRSWLQEQRSDSTPVDIV